MRELAWGGRSYNSELGEETQSEDAGSEGNVAGGAGETSPRSTENKLRFVVRTLVFRLVKE